MPTTSLFHINDFDHYDLMPYQKFLLHAPLSGAPQKCFQSDLVLAKAGRSLGRRLLTEINGSR